MVLDVHLGDVVDASGEGSVRVELDLTPGLGATVNVHLDGEARVVEMDVAAEGGAEVEASWAIGDAEASGELYAGGVWLRPRPVAPPALRLGLSGSGATAVTVYARGAPVPPARRERSLVWTDPIVVDDPEIVGLARVLAGASSDGHGGVLLDRWFRRFATTLHSERAAPAELMDEVALSQGPDPTSWNLDLLPFVVTGVHNRLDLGPRGGGCGEIRVSLASTHPLYSPLHVIFLFRQAPREDDVAPDGTPHCLGTARRWARLSDLDGAAFAEAAASLLAESLVRERFLLAESVELTVSPWEWRQWMEVGVDELDNPPLFQTVATPFLNPPGPLRDDFLAWVGDNAAAIADRTAEIPSSFRFASAQAPPSVPAEALDLTGLDPVLLASQPGLARALEIVGCPTCHTDDANFVHTSRDRVFSPFYDKELDARAARLDEQNLGVLVPMPPFGPLQAIAP